MNMRAMEQFEVLDTELLVSVEGGSVKPPVCSYPSAWNPAPVIRC